MLFIPNSITHKCFCYNHLATGLICHLPQVYLKLSIFYDEVYWTARVDHAILEMRLQSATPRHERGTCSL